MFDKVKNWILRGINRMLSKSTIEEALKIKTAISDEMDRAIRLWFNIFINKAPWQDDEIQSLQLAASIAEEFARLTTLEMKSEVTGSARADYINVVYQKVLDDLKTKMALFNAVGGGFFKPYITKNMDLIVDFVPQSDCKPLKHDDAGNITSIVFTTQIAKAENIYTRLETHTLQNTDYKVENKVYVTNKYNSGMLGKRANLADVEEWADLQEVAVIKHVEKPLFAYYKVPLSNNLDTKSCLGISVYHKAVNSLKKADVQAARLDYEYESAERSIYADLYALQNKDNKETRSRIVKTLNFGEDNFYKEFSPAIRDEAFIRGLEKIKQEIEFQCQLAYGTISDPGYVDKTATEIKASKQRSYSAVSLLQKSLEKALKHLVYILDVYCTLYKLVPAGKCEVSAEWDDSILIDTQQEQTIQMQEVGQGLMSKVTYNMKRYGLTEEQALEELERVAAETNSRNMMGFEE